MPSKLGKIKILHVDDEGDTLKVVKIILEKEGYEVDSVRQGAEALEKIKENGYDLLILDIMMPDMSGWELFSHISKIKHDYRVIFLSVLEVTDEKLRELKEAGIKDYIKKPFDRDELVKKVNIALKS